MTFREKIRDSFHRKQKTQPSPPIRSSYPYQQLATNQIRLLVLHPGEPGGPIRCSLQPVNLLDYDDLTALAEAKALKHYDAISYVWGDSKTTFPIHCDGQTVNVTANLRDSLERLRHPTETSNLWADALCIDQSNYDERAEQVRLMGLIFFKARSVHIWLGHNVFKGTVNSAENAVSLIREKGPLKKEQSTIESLAHGPQLHQYGSTLDGAEEKWKAIGHLLDAPWFQRVWVVQELGVAREATFYCGNVSFKRRELYDFVAFMESRGPLLAYAYQLDLRMLRLASQFTVAVWSSNRIELGSDPALAETFLEVLESARGLECTDKRDSIHALLGHPSAFKHSLLDGSPYTWYPRIYYERRQPLVQPDYNTTNTFLDVYLNAVVRYIETLNLGLDVLCYVAHNENTMKDDFPSWVPRWDISRMHLSLSARDGFYNASGKLPATTFTLIRRSKNHPVSRIELKALYLGQITFTRILTTETLYTSIEPLVSWDGDNVVGQKQHGRQFTKDPTTLAATLTAGLRTGEDLFFQPTAENPAEHFERFQSFMRRGKAKSQLKPDTSSSEADSNLDRENDTEADYFEVDFWKQGHGRTFFNTANGGSGLGPTISKHGDELWLPMGSQMPFVFRKTGSLNKYKIVGQAYVHGVMGGEAVESLTEDDFKMITLS